MQRSTKPGKYSMWGFKRQEARSNRQGGNGNGGRWGQRAQLLRMRGWASSEPESLSCSGGCLGGETGLVEEAAHRSHARYVSVICQLHVSHMSAPIYLGLVKEVVT